MTRLQGVVGIGVHEMDALFPATSRYLFGVCAVLDDVGFYAEDLALRGILRCVIIVYQIVE